MSEQTSGNDRRAVLFSGITAFLALLVLARGTRVIGAYMARFREAHSSGAIVAVIAGIAALLLLLFIGTWRSPRATAIAVAAAAIALAIRTGNGPAMAVALVLAGCTLVLGDLVVRAFRGREAREGETAISIPAGAVATGGALLLLGEAGLARPLPLAVIVLAVIFLRRRRIPALAKLLQRAASEATRRRSAIESLWLAVVVAVVSAAFIGVLRPDVSYDALSYHLPEIRDFAERGRVRAFPQIPETFLWHNHDIFLGAAFLAGGERTVRFLHYFVGLALFGAVSALARRWERGTAPSLALLAIAAFPAGCVQLEETYVDLFAALCLTASAFELVNSDVEPRRVGLAGFFFGGAVATKIFASLALPGLIVLLIRRRSSMKSVLAFALFSVLPLAPWFAWSQARTGFFLSPYSDPIIKGPSSLIDGIYVQPRPAAGSAPTGLGGFLNLPLARTFREVRISSSAEGVAGFLPIVLLLGSVGWGARRFGLFLFASLAALVPWYVLSGARVFFPSIRFLIALYPLYAVFNAVGLARRTRDFRRGWGTAAAVSLASLAVAFPAQFFSTPYDIRAAFERIPREEVLAAYLPPYPLWKQIRPEDRVLMIGDWDHFHCPARYSVKEVDLPVDPHDAPGWRNLVRELEITHVLFQGGQRRKWILESLENCAEEIGRHRGAVLYRLRGGPGECSGLPRPPTRAVGAERPSAAAESSTEN